MFRASELVGPHAASQRGAAFLRYGLVLHGSRMSSANLYLITTVQGEDRKLGGPLVDFRSLKGDGRQVQDSLRIIVWADKTLSGQTVIVNKGRALIAFHAFTRRLRTVNKVWDIR